MFCVNKSSNATSLLSLCNGMDSQRSLTRTLRTIDFNDASTRIPSYTKCSIQAYTACRYHLNILNMLVAKLHNTSFTEVFFYFRHGCLKCFELFILRISSLFHFFLCHYVLIL